MLPGPGKKDLTFCVRGPTTSLDFTAVILPVCLTGLPRIRRTLDCAATAGMLVVSSRIGVRCSCFANWR